MKDINHRGQQKVAAKDRECRMTLDEAIKHTLEIANKDKYMLCKECKEDHLQLAKWLIELKMYRRIVHKALEK